MVPFLVLLPLVEQTDLTSSGAMDLLSQLGPTALVTLGSLGLLLLGGRIILRRVFEVRPYEVVEGRVVGAPSWGIDRRVIGAHFYIIEGRIIGMRPCGSSEVLARKIIRAQCLLGHKGEP